MRLVKRRIESMPPTWRWWLHIQISPHITHEAALPRGDSRVDSKRSHFQLQCYDSQLARLLISNPNRAQLSATDQTCHWTAQMFPKLQYSGSCDRMVLTRTPMTTAQSTSRAGQRNRPGQLNWTGQRTAHAISELDIKMAVVSTGAMASLYIRQNLLSIP